MEKTHETMEGPMRTFIEKQLLFFVAITLLDRSGHLNLSQMESTVFAYCDHDGRLVWTLSVATM